MPNFTEGEWQYAIWKCRNNVEYWNIYRITDNKVDCIALDIGLESDARLMAQSKKMYEVLNKIMDHFARGGVMQTAPWIEARAILSEIDKE